MLENPMYLADPPEPDYNEESENYEHSVDLKWSLWSMNKETWEERAPGVWDWMREWFEAEIDMGDPKQWAAVLNGEKTVFGLDEPPRKVDTAPRKEIRFGAVEIKPGEAYVHFWGEWDDGRTFHIDETVKAETFEELMHKIDHLEVDLMRDEHEAYHGKQGNRLQSLRCHECGYPYESPKSRRLA